MPEHTEQPPGVLERMPWRALGALAVMLAPAAAPAGAASIVALLSALVGAATLALLVAVRPRPVTRFAVGAVLACALLATPILGSVFAAAPGVSFIGLVGQHAGGATWLAAVLWFAVTALSGTRADLRLLTRAVAVVGAAYAGLALLQHLGIVPQRFAEWGAAEAVFANPLELAQMLVLALGCSLAWALATPVRGQRFAALACAVAAAVGALITEASLPWFALIVMGGTYAALSLPARTPGRGWRFSAMLATVSVLVAAVASAVAANAFGPAVFATANRLTNLRFAIWNSAVARLVADPLRPQGLDQFSAWVDWGINPDRSLYVYSAYDPHNVVYAALLGGGVLGGLLALLGAAWLLGALVDTHDRGGASRPVRALVAGLIGYTAALTVSWVVTVTSVVAAALAGLIIAQAPPRNEGRLAGTTTRTWARGTGVTLLAIAVAAGVVVAPAVRVEYRFALTQDASGLAPLSSSLSALRDRPTATYAYAALSRLAPDALDGDADAVTLASEVHAVATDHVTYYVDLALLDAEMARVLEPDDIQAAWRLYSAAIERGRKADPATGLWDTAAALTADAWGLDAEARDYAARALEYPQLSDPARRTLEQLLAAP